MGLKQGDDPFLLEYVITREGLRDITINLSSSLLSILQTSSETRLSAWSFTRFLVQFIPLNSGQLPDPPTTYPKTRSTQDAIQHQSNHANSRSHWHSVSTTSVLRKHGRVHPMLTLDQWLESRRSSAQTKTSPPAPTTPPSQSP